MSHYAVEELIERWKREDVTAEQMIGQMLQILKVQEQQLRELRHSAATAHQPQAPQPKAANKL